MMLRMGGRAIPPVSSALNADGDLRHSLVSLGLLAAQLQPCPSARPG